MIKQADKMKRCKLDNNAIPNEPTLTESDKADTQEFLNEMLSIFPLVEIKVFDKMCIRDRIVILKETAAINNFWDKAAERRRIEGMIEDEVRYSGIRELSVKASEITSELMKLAKNRESDLR